MIYQLQIRYFLDLLKIRIPKI